MLCRAAACTVLHKAVRWHLAAEHRMLELPFRGLWQVGSAAETVSLSPIVQEQRRTLCWLGEGCLQLLLHLIPMAEQLIGCGAA